MTLLSLSDALSQAITFYLDSIKGRYFRYDFLAFLHISHFSTSSTQFYSSCSVSLFIIESSLFIFLDRFFINL